jgi:phosphopantetheine--protein transferase-like protein
VFAPASEKAHILKTLDPINGCSYDRPMNQAAHPAEAQRAGLLNTASIPPGHDPAIAAAPDLSALAIGLDIECCDNLPASDDPCSEPFYLENFTPAEIDWCRRQPDSRLSFCRIWSAKEAAIKCSLELAALHPIEIEVWHGARGRPMLCATRASCRSIASDCVLSITQSGRNCMAVCVRKPANPAPD